MQKHHPLDASRPLPALFLPWQIAFLGCWAPHFVTCVTYVPAPPPGDALVPPPHSTQNLHFRTARSAPHDAQQILLESFPSQCQYWQYGRARSSQQAWVLLSQVQTITCHQRQQQQWRHGHRD